MLRNLFRRKKLTQAELAERDRLRRDATKARHRAEAEMARQRGQVESRQPPDAGGFY
jgi:hypothetical protein